MKKQTLCRGWLGYLLLPVLLVTGCTRAFYREQADAEAYQLIAEKAQHPHWSLPPFSVDPDPRSRFYQPGPKDFPPMPPDDPEAHKLMHRVDGKNGFRYWHAYGDTPFVENPLWEAYLPVDENGEVVMRLDTAMELAQLHSRNYQTQLEELYLSALDVAFERFRFDVQYFADTSTTYTARGSALGGGRSSSQLQVDNNAQLRRLLASGGQLLVGFANTFVWQFSGSNTYTTNSLLDFSLVQPLLRGGARARVMERLTLAERTLLANIRAMERFRREFFVQVAIGANAGAGPNRRGGFFGGAGLEGFAGVGGGGFGRVGAFGGGAGGAGGFAGGAGAAQAGGYLGLLQDLQEIENQRANVAALADSLRLLEAFHQANRIDRLQVDMARQALFNAQSRLLTAQAQFQATLDGFKMTLGLPPDLRVRLQDDRLEPFDLLGESMLQLQSEATDVLASMWSGPRDAQGNSQPVPEPLQQAKETLRQDMRTLQRVADLLDRYRYLADPQQQQVDRAKLGQQIRLMQELVEYHRRLINAMDPLVYYPQGLKGAVNIHRQARRQLDDVQQAIQRMLQQQSRREAILRDLAQREEVRQGQVEREAFDVEAYRRLVAEQQQIFQAIRQRLQRPEQFWNEHVLQLERLQQPMQQTLQRLHNQVEQLVPVVQQVSKQTGRLTVGQDGRPIQEQLQQLVQGLSQVVQAVDRVTPALEQERRRLAAFVPQLERTQRRALEEVSQLVQDVGDLGLVRARARLESVVLTKVDMDELTAMRLAQQFRRDWMNARASLVDSWRLIEFNANDLLSQLDVEFSGSLGTLADNPFRFRDDAGQLRVGIQFDAPLTRINERNIYRQALIEFNQARRAYIGFVDGIHAGLRNILRTMRLNEINFELRRRAVHIALDQVEVARLRLFAPPKPGEQGTFGATTARDLVSALSDLLSVQNDYLSVWVNYEMQRLVLDRDLGTMRLDDRGMWVDPGPYVGQVPLEDEARDDQPEPESVPEPEDAPAGKPASLPAGEQDKSARDAADPAAQANANSVQLSFKTGSSAAGP